MTGDHERDQTIEELRAAQQEQTERIALLEGQRRSPAPHDSRRTTCRSDDPAALHAAGCSRQRPWEPSAWLARKRRVPWEQSAPSQPPAPPYRPSNHQSLYCHHNRSST